MSDEEPELEVAEEGGDEQPWDQPEQGEGGAMAGGCVGCCIGIILFPLALLALGWNEMNYVCTAKSIVYSLGQVSNAVDCNSAPPAGPVFYSCPVNDTSVPRWSTVDFASTNLAAVESEDLWTMNETGGTWKAIVTSRTTQYYGCDETKSSNRRRVTSTTYSYTKKWMSAGSWTRPTQCSRATQSTCGRNACLEPPASLQPSSVSKYAAEVKAGIFTIPQSKLRSTINLMATNSELLSYNNLTCATSPTVGCSQVEYKSGNPQYLSGVARAEGQGLADIIVPASWGCSDSPYWPSVAGSAQLTLPQIRQTLEDTNTVQVWVFRAVGMLLSIIGIFLCLSPIAAAADMMGDMLSYIPCVGGFLEDAIEGVVNSVLCGISCAVGISCSLLVIGVMQLFLQPLIGAACLAGFCLCCGCAYAYGKSSDKPRKKQKGMDAGNMEMQQAPMQQPMYQGPPQPQYGGQPMGQPMMQQPMYQGQPQYGGQPMGQPMMQQPMYQGQPQYGGQPMGQPMMAQPMMQPQTITLTVPQGYGPGMPVQFQTPDGRPMTVPVPEGCFEGMQFQIMA